MKVEAGAGHVVEARGSSTRVRYVGQHGPRGRGLYVTAPMQHATARRAREYAERLAREIRQQLRSET